MFKISIILAHSVIVLAALNSAHASYPTIREGSKGEAVELLQRTLNAKFWLEMDVDSNFGSATKQAVIDFQTSRGLGADGIVGPSTWAALFADRPTIRSGDRGPDVRFLQFALNDLLALPTPIDTDGIFGAGTENQVKELQRRGGVVDDGIVGQDTWKLVEGVFSDSWTERTYFSIRKQPGTAASNPPIGKLTGERFPVDVFKFEVANDIQWYQVRFKESVSAAVPRGTVAWLGSETVKPVAKWSFFKDQLTSWEAQNEALRARARVTLLRQMSHKEDLPFDKIIGTDEGTVYLDSRAPTANWQILREVQSVRMPDGCEVDIQHLLVGLDVLVHPIISDITYYGFPLDIGENIAAATWAGDIGAGATDALLEQDSVWESEQTRTDADRVDRYYITRAPMADLLGDIDAWGIRIPDGSEKLADILAQYYESPDLGTKRKEAVGRFLAHYRYDSTQPLQPQDATATLKELVFKFGIVWDKYRTNPLPLTPAKKQRLKDVFVSPMTDRFIQTLETLK